MSEGDAPGEISGAGESSGSPVREPGRAALDPVAAALAVGAAGHDPLLASEAATYFRKRSALLDLQAEDLRDDRVLLQAQLELSVKQLRLARISSVLKVATQVLLIVAGVVIGAGALLFIRDAAASRSVVVEAFDAPAGLAPSGLTGQVVAGRLLDQLTHIQTTTRAAAVKRNLSGAWTNDITIEVPETGISLGELQRVIRRIFGHDLQIDGDLVEPSPGTFALTVRGSGVLPRTFTGPAADFDRLTAEAAQYVYSQSQPYLYIDYLRTTNRLAEAVAFARDSYATADRDDQPFILNQWAFASQSNGGSAQEGLTLLREALRLKPDYWVAYNNVINTVWSLGREEEAWRVGNDMRRIAGGRPGRAPELYYQNWDHLVWNLQAKRAGLLADAASHGGINTTFTAIGPIYADIDARLHDFDAAELNLQATPAATTDPVSAALGHFVRALIAQERGDIAVAAAEMGVFASAYANPVVSYNLPGFHCWIAPIEEAAGHPDKADAVLKTNSSFVDCRRFAADILDRRGDWPGAQHAYAAAVALAPSLPAGYYSWGLALARHGDLAGAAEKLAAASTRGPTWADPLKAWGDVLARREQWQEALAKYDRARTFAPAWEALGQARAAAEKTRR